MLYQMRTNVPFIIHSVRMNIGNMIGASIALNSNSGTNEDKILMFSSKTYFVLLDTEFTRHLPDLKSME